MNLSKKQSDNSSKSSLKNRRNNRLILVNNENVAVPLGQPNEPVEHNSSNSGQNSVEQNVVYNLMRQNSKNSKPSSDNSHLAKRSHSNKT